MCGIISGVDQVLFDSHTEQVVTRVGVFIAFHEHLNYKILEEYTHDGGNYLIIHSLIQDMPMVLVNYYVPMLKMSKLRC